MKAYTTDSIEWALDNHKRHGRIKEWKREVSSSRLRYVVTLNNRENPFLLASLREAYILVQGLTSAANCDRVGHTTT